MTSAHKEKGKRQRVKPDKSGPTTEAINTSIAKGSKCIHCGRVHAVRRGQNVLIYIVRRKFSFDLGLVQRIKGNGLEEFI